jgi:predicted nucleotidyltransferase
MAQIPLAIEQPLKSYLNDLAQYYRLDRVILFGSFALGTFRGDSDVDLAIFSPDVTAENEIEIMADLMIRAMPYKLDIQPLVFPLADYYDTTNDFIQKEIIAGGIEIPVPKGVPDARR